MSPSVRASLGLFLFLLTWVWLYFGFSWVVLWPSITALMWVVLFRRVFVALLGGALVGSIMLAAGNPWLGFVQLFEVHLLPHFASPWKSGALIFTLVLGGFAAVLEQMGVLRGWLVQLNSAGSRRRLEAMAMGFGVLCFFDGLANSLMVGRLFREMADRVGMSRARLAYIVDTTSAAVACISFISTWIAFQLDQIKTGLSLAGRADFADPYALFFKSIPVNFYCWYALVLLAAVVFRGWDFGPMRSASIGGRLIEEFGKAGPVETNSGGRWRFFVPIVVLIVAILGGIYADGLGALGERGRDMTLAPRISAAFGLANAAVVMVWASVLGAVAAILCFPARSGGIAKGLQAFEEGVLALFKPALILVGAWMLSSTLGQLKASEVLAGLLSDRLTLSFLPAGVFLVAALTSFTTGTSWGTMGILMPLALPLAFSLSPGMEDRLVEAAVVGVIAAVFSGAVFGDHASPLSDTTIVSSIACGIEPHEHVKTQLPYALLAGAWALLFGFLPMLLLPVAGALVGVGSAGLVLLVYLVTQRERRRG